MDQPRWIPQLYGYSVCFIAIVTLLFSGSSIVGNTFEYLQPELSAQVTTEFGGRSLEACRQRYLARTPDRRSAPPPASGPPMPPDSVLAQLCAEERAERIAGVRHSALRGLISSTLMSLFAILLFVLHWRWLRGTRAAMT